MFVAGKALIGAAAEFGGPGSLLPTRNAELFRWCLHQGLRVQQTLTLMSLGLYKEPAGAFLPSILFEDGRGNPSLQTFEEWLARNKERIPIER